MVGSISRKFVPEFAYQLHNQHRGLFQVLLGLFRMQTLTLLYLQMSFYRKFWFAANEKAHEPNQCENYHHSSRGAIDCIRSVLQSIGELALICFLLTEFSLEAIMDGRLIF
jgi:hypothetical protein